MRRLAAIVALLMALAAAPALAETTARVAVEQLPLAHGNPFRTSLAPSVYSTAGIFDALARFDAAGVLRPALAVRWEKIDALTWRFHLRPGVQFHNGAPLTSAAVVNAVAFLSSPEAAREGLKRELSVIGQARAVDALSVDIVTKEPVALFPRYATSLSLPEPGAWTALGAEEFSKAPVGTGPFQVARMAANAWSLRKFPASWRPARVDALELVMLPDTAARVQALEAGLVDIAMVIGPDNIGAVEAAGGRVHASLVASIYGLSFITTRGGPFADARVRLALNLGVDRERIVATLLAGRTVPAGQPAARQAFGYDPDIPAYPHDPVRAKQLLAEAGYPKGLSFVLDAPTGAAAGDAAVFQQVQSDLREIGVRMDIKTMPYALYLEKTAKVDFTGDAFPVTWPSWPLLDVWRALQIHSCFRPAYWYCNPELTPTLKALVAESDETKALAMRRAVGRIYHDEAPAILLYELPLFVGLGPRVTSFSVVGNFIAYDELELKAK